MRESESENHVAVRFAGVGEDGRRKTDEGKESAMAKGNNRQQKNIKKPKKDKAAAKGAKK